MRGSSNLSAFTLAMMTVAVIVAEEAMGETSHLLFFPLLNGPDAFAFLGGIILLFAGVEVHAVHAHELANPKRQYPQVVLLSLVVVIVLFTLGSMAIAVMIPPGEISLDVGLMQGFTVGLKHLHLDALIPVMGLLVAFGVVSSGL